MQPTVIELGLNLDDVTPAPKISKSVVLITQSFCAPCGATEPHMDALAKEFGFSVKKVNVDGRVTAELAGTVVPSIVIYQDGKMSAIPLRGTRTKAVIKQYLTVNGVIKS